MIDFDFSSLGGILRGAGIAPSLISGLRPRTRIIFADGEDEGKEVFKSGSLQRLEYSKESNVNTAPIEGVEGLASSFSSYDKIETPDILKIEYIFEGGSEYFGELAKITDFNIESVSQVLRRLDSMQNKTGLYNIETMNRMYVGYDLVSYAHATKVGQPNSWLVVVMTFQKINAKLAVRYDVGNNKIAKDKSEAMLTKKTKGNIQNVSISDQVSAISNKANEMFRDSVNTVTAAADSIIDRINEVLQ